MFRSLCLVFLCRLVFMQVGYILHGDAIMVIGRRCISKLIYQDHKRTDNRSVFYQKYLYSTVGLKLWCLN